jgi:hypothetical protein
MALALTSSRKSNALNKIPLIFASFIISIALQNNVSAQTYGTSSHTVTINVSAITVLAVSSASVSLVIDGTGAVAGQDQMSVVNQTTSLLWGVNTTPKKITAVSNLAAPKFTTKLLALSPTTGTAAAELIVDNTAADLMLNIGLSRGSCTLRYTGIALASQGIGSDNHIVTFTITVQ